ncbi:hypothetical protein M9458_010138, partial [Cirrhinus mrigala]
FHVSTRNLFLQIEADCSAALSSRVTTEDENKSADSVWTRLCVSDGDYITRSALPSDQRNYTKNSINSLTDTSQYHVE